MSQITRELKLIQVVYKGVEGYLCSTSCFTENPITQDPLKAYDYNEMVDKPFSRSDEKMLAHNLKNDLFNLVVEGDEMWAKSGVRIDALPKVTVIVVTTLTTVKSVEQGRDFNCAPQMK